MNQSANIRIGPGTVKPYGLPNAIDLHEYGCLKESSLLTGTLPGERSGQLSLDGS